MEKKLVIIPTYNEIENISKILQAVFALEGDYHILVIDDGSPDGTAAVVRSLQKVYPEKLHLLERSCKLGLGTAYVTGFKWALSRDYDYVFEMDADFSHNPARPTCRACWRPARAAPTSRSARATATASTSSTGRSAAS